MPFYRLLLSAAFFLLLLFSANGYAEEMPGDVFSKDVPVEITADTVTYDRSTDTYHATGNVEIVQDTTTLKADSAILDMASGVATASGNVNIIDEGGNAMQGKSLQFNLREKTAVIANGRLFYRDGNIHITGDEIKKTGPETYEARRLTYTSCDCPEPDMEPAWSFAATSAKVTVGEFLTGWNARFHIKGVPVLYSPYISIPIKRERQTGFLQPRPGYSELRGFVLENSFFWAISGNTDATFYLDIETKRGEGKGIEYRYIRKKDSYGELYLYQFQEKDITRVRDFRSGVENLSRPEDAGESRWRLKYLHSELFRGFNIKAKLDFLSDDEYFIDFGKDSSERSLESVESNVSVSKSWSVYSFVAQARLFNNLLDAEDKTTLQRLPEVTFANAEKRIFSTPFYISSETSLINFWRETGTRGSRLDVRPRVSLPMRPAGLFDFTPSFAPRATFYLVSEHPGGRYSERYIYDAKADLSTTFVRVYGTGDGDLKALRHTIRPSMVYTYVPEAVQSDLPSFDAVDNISPANSLTYALNSTLTGKLTEDSGLYSYFDYLYMDLSQTFNIYEARRDLVGPGDERRPFSEISGELIVRPGPRVAATARGKFDIYQNRFTSYDTSVAAADSRGDALSLSHRFVKDGANYLEASLRARATKSVDLTYLKRYSFDEGRSLETAYGIEYSHQCWSSTLTYTERLEEKVVYLTFNLMGIGRVAGISGKFGPE